MTSRIRRAVYLIVVSAICLANSECLFWQLTADRLVEFYPLRGMVVYSIRVGDRLYVCTEVDDSVNRQITILDVSDPLELQEVDAVGLDYFGHAAFERIAVYNDFLILEAGSVMRIADAMQVPSRAYQDWYDFHDTHDQQARCLVHGDYLVRIVNFTYPDLTIHVYAMSDILTVQDPPIISTLTVPGSSVDSSTAAAIAGDSLYIATGNSFRIVDLADINNPTEVSHCGVPTLGLTGNRLTVAADRVYILPGDVYTWDWGNGDDGEAIAVDVSDHSAPSVAFTIESVGAPSAVSGNYLLTRSGQSIDVYDMAGGADANRVATLNVRLETSAIHPVGDFALVTEARPYHDGGVGTVLLAPYR